MNLNLKYCESNDVSFIHEKYKNIIEIFVTKSDDCLFKNFSIYDFIMDKYETIDEVKWPIHKIIMRWCDDDDNRNILYKNNDEERYPDFKLYKMIARKVNKHVPMDELNNKYFNKYIVSKKEIKKGTKIMNLDNIIQGGQINPLVPINEPCD